MKYKDFAINIAKKAGKIILENFKMGMKKEWKKDETPVTFTDRKINKMVGETISKYFPDHSFLLEEGSSIDKKSPYMWLCDPVDGTIPFSHGIPTCVFVLALLKNGIPILGVIYDPFLNRMFFAEKGKGAFLNNKKIKVSKANDLKICVIGITFWRFALYDITKFAANTSESGALIINTGSANYMGMLVAGGELAANIWPSKTPWDVAAQKIIIEEAGGKVTDLFGNEQRYDTDIHGCVASNGLIHDKLLCIIKESGVRKKSDV